MKVLVVDVGGTHVKILATGHRAKRELTSGPTLTAERMLDRAKRLVQDWTYAVVTMGYARPVPTNGPVAGPSNLGPRSVVAHWAGGFGLPVEVINGAVRHH